MRQRIQLVEQCLMALVGLGDINIIIFNILLILLHKVYNRIIDSQENSEGQLITDSQKKWVL